MRYILANPRYLRRTAFALAGTGAGLGCLATFLRADTDAGTWTYLLDTMAWVVASVGAITEARVAVILGSFQPTSVRRRGTVLLAAGVFAGLLGCILLSVLDVGGGAQVGRILAAGSLVAGVWAGLSGLLTLSITVGARYAADRLAELDVENHRK